MRTALIQILLEPKNALTKQYKKLFEMEGVDLEFRDDALRAVANKSDGTQDRRSGPAYHSRERIAGHDVRLAVVGEREEGGR